MPASDKLNIQLSVSGLNRAAYKTKYRYGLRSMIVFWWERIGFDS
jgi:hypothetical protein